MKSSNDLRTSLEGWYFFLFYFWVLGQTQIVAQENAGIWGARDPFSVIYKTKLDSIYSLQTLPNIYTLSST